MSVLGVGNCCSSLVQGLSFYGARGGRAVGLCRPLIGPYGPKDIRIVAAFDIDARKVGRDVAQAIFAPPNSTAVFCADVARSGAVVQMGAVLDGFPAHMSDYEESERFVLADEPEPSADQVVSVLRESRTDVVLNYLPVGSEAATRFYASCALRAGAAFVNCIPVFIASDPEWAARYARENVPLVGDDVKSQLGATIVHRTLVDLLKRRGVELTRTYQLNTGGNTDFLNMLDRRRVASKKKSKTEAVQSAAARRLEPRDIHVGPSDYVPWLKDRKICFMRIEGKLFGEIDMDLELRLSVEDSPNSAGVVIDAIRCAKLALDRGQGGVLTGASASFFKHPPMQYSDEHALRLLEEYIAGGRA